MTDLSKKAAKMLLNGATLVAEPCPYCSGVRVIKDGHALCTVCGREPDSKKHPAVDDAPNISALERLEKKLECLVTEMESAEPEKIQQLLESIDTLASAISKLKK